MTAFWALVRAQHGVVARWQLLGLGFTEDVIAGRLGTSLFRVHQGVYAVGRPELSERGRWMAAVLACGSGAALSHGSAAKLWRISDSDTGRPHVCVPPGRHPHHPAIAIHRPAVMPPTTVEAGIPVVTPLFTLIDLAPRCTHGRLAALTNTADKLGLVRTDDALDELLRHPGRRGTRKLREVLTAHRVTDSDLERRFLELAAQAGLAAPRTQVSLCGFRVDFYWPELGLVVETDGLTYHRTPHQQARDRVRDQALMAAGLTCLRFTNAQVRREPRSVIHTLQAVAARLGTAAGHFAA